MSVQSYRGLADRINTLLRILFPLADIDCAEDFASRNVWASVTFPGGEPTYQKIADTFQEFEAWARLVQSKIKMFEPSLHERNERRRRLRA